MTAMFVLVEVAGVAFLVAVIVVTMRHACNPRRDAGLHRPGRHTSRHPAKVARLYPTVTTGDLL